MRLACPQTHISTCPPFIHDPGLTGAVRHVGLPQLLPLFAECTRQQSAGVAVDDQAFRIFLEVLNQLGYVCLAGAGSEQEVIFDSTWLIEMLTRVVRDPEHHRPPMLDDRRTPQDLRNRLYVEGFLDDDLVPYLWNGLSATVWQNLFHLAQQLGVFVRMRRGKAWGHLVPSLLPTQRLDMPPLPMRGLHVTLAFYSGMALSAETYTRRELSARCHSPASLFEQLVAHLVQLNHEGTVLALSEPMLSRSVSRLWLGNEAVWLAPDSATGCIRVWLETAAALGKVGGSWCAVVWRRGKSRARMRA